MFRIVLFLMAVAVTAAFGQTKFPGVGKVASAERVKMAWA